MADKKDLILVVSNSMDTNKKPDRDENALIRLPASTRKYMNFMQDEVNIGKEENNVPEVVVRVFKAFHKDIVQVTESGKYSPEQLKRIAFVTSDVYKRVNSPKIKLEKAPFSTLIGADPEFLLFNNDGKVICAIDVMSKHGKIGSDGAMAEIRPEPSEDPSILVDNIKLLLSDKALTNKILPYNWMAGVYYKDDVRDYPIGGHIHLGNPVGIDKLSISKKMFLFAVLNKIMDELLAIPMIKLDGNDLGRHRRSECKMTLAGNGYGYYGEWRQCDGRLEHRTLSGLWLMHPELAKCVLGTAKAISNEMFGIVHAEDYRDTLFTHPNIGLLEHKNLYRPEFDDWGSIEIAKKLGCTSSSAFMSSMLNSSKSNNITKALLSDWYAHMKSLSSYNKYSHYIDKLYKILNLPKNEVTKTGLNIKDNWLNNKSFPI